MVFLITLGVLFTVGGLLQVHYIQEAIAHPIPSAETVNRASRDARQAEIYCALKKKEAEEICGSGDTSVGNWRACEAAMEDAAEACEAADYWRSVYFHYYRLRYFHLHTH